MSPADVANMIGNYGFPIVCCGAMFWYMVKKTHSTKMKPKVCERQSKITH